MKTIKMLVMAMVVVFGFAVNNALSFTEIMKNTKNIFLVKYIDEMTDDESYCIIIDSTNEKCRICLTKNKIFLLESDYSLKAKYAGVPTTLISTLFRFDEFKAIEVPLGGEWDDLHTIGAMGDLGNQLISAMLDNTKKLRIQVDLLLHGSTIFEFKLEGLKPIYDMMENI